MKRSITSLIASGLVSCALAMGITASSTALAQTSSGVKATIPFAFQVGGRVLPAGTYTFSQDGTHIMALRGSAPHAQILTMVLPQTEMKAPRVGSITFTLYGDRYFLHRVASSDSTTAYELTRSKQEKQIIRELNLQKAATEVAINIEPNLPR